MKHNTISKRMTSRLTRGWKGYCGQVLIFIGACLLLNWYQEKQEQRDTPLSAWGEVPEREE